MFASPGTSAALLGVLFARRAVFLCAASLEHAVRHVSLGDGGQRREGTVSILTELQEQPPGENDLAFLDDYTCSDLFVRTPFASRTRGQIGRASPPPARHCVW